MVMVIIMTKTISDVINKSRIKVKVAMIMCIKTSFIELENKEPTLKSCAVVLQIRNLLWHLKKTGIPPSCF